MKNQCRDLDLDLLFRLTRGKGCQKTIKFTYSSFCVFFFCFFSAAVANMQEFRLIQINFNEVWQTKHFSPV